jgi:GT2 family glycosyltransferase
VLSAIVSTRDRPDHALACAEALLRCPEVAELVFVDQSDGADTRRALANVHDRRLLVVPCRRRGCASGRNDGVAVARGDLLAFTDDDCRVSPEWARRITEAFASDASVGAVCGRVSVPQTLLAGGTASSFEPRGPAWRGAFGEWGIGANLSVRRAVLERVGGFDELLGAGTPLGSGEDVDLQYRVLRAGLTVANAAAAAVEHLGVRAHGTDSRRLWRAYGLGTGAAIFKHVRLGDPLATRLYVSWLAACVAWNLRGIAERGRPVALGYTAAFVAGGLRALEFAVDGPTRMYARRGKFPTSTNRSSAA